MSEDRFVDFYEILQVSPNADHDTIDRVYRHLAKRVHPDNPQTGDQGRFELLVRAFRTLSDSEKRAAYDSKYQQGRADQWAIVQEVNESDGFNEDVELRRKVLSLLYVQRRRDMRNPGLGNMELERLIACPLEHMEFHIWYLKQKGYIERTDEGFLAITVAGVEQVEQIGNPLRKDRLLSAPGLPSLNETA